MSGVYLVPHGWDAGCDDCGEVVITWDKDVGEQWCDNHVCPTPSRELRNLLRRAYGREL